MIAAANFWVYILNKLRCLLFLFLMECKNGAPEHSGVSLCNVTVRSYKPGLKKSMDTGTNAQSEMYTQALGSCTSIFRPGSYIANMLQLQQHKETKTKKANQE